MEELTVVLHKFNQNIVEASRQVCRETITFCMTHVVLPLLEKVGEIDPRFKCTSPMPNEAYFEGMHSSSENEFELVVLLTNLLQTKSFDDAGLQDSNLSCYGRIVTNEGFYSLGDLVYEKTTQGHNILSSERVRQVFLQLISKASSMLPLLGVTLEISLKDHCTVVKISQGSEVFLFNLVPAFVFPKEWPPSACLWCEETSEWLSEKDVKVAQSLGFYALALPCPSAPSDNSLFRISFSMVEKYLLRTKLLAGATAIQADGVPHSGVFRKDCDRILGMLRESDKDDFHPVNSYHIKTCILHQCSRWPDDMAWSADKLGERFLELFRDLILALDSQDLRHFFMRDCNLLRFYPPETLVAAASRLRAIYEDIIRSPANSIRLQC